MAMTSTCACCGNPARGPDEWSWCAECQSAGCVRLRTDAEGGDVRRGRRCPLLLRPDGGSSRTVTTPGLAPPLHMPAQSRDDDDADTIVVDVDEVGR